jgi:hypothetical protein
VFKVILNAVYIASGILMFSMFVSNAATHFGGHKELTPQEYVEVDCYNCDEID